jgi:uncharacterized protein (DUF488 family)
MLLFCERTGINYYDFFAYKYGGYSLVLSQDREKLIELGHLENRTGFVLSKSQSFVSQLRPVDQMALNALVKEFNNQDTRSIVRQAYLEYPQLTLKSTIASTVLNSQELNIWQQHRDSSDEPALFTIGYEGISIDAYLDKLVSNGAKVLIDVRKNPVSRKYGFSKNTLRGFLKSCGVSYFHFPDLGVPSKLRRSLDQPEDYQALFQHYKEAILPKQETAIDEVCTLLEHYQRIALTCFEADPEMCHRYSLAEFIKQYLDIGVPIVHL